MPNEALEIGRRVRARRRVLDLSQKDLADSLGLSFQQISKYEQGHSAPSAIILARIAITLGISIGDLLPESLKSPASRTEAKSGGGQIAA